jgi:hypothetical protein
MTLVITDHPSNDDIGRDWLRRFEHKNIQMIRPFRDDSPVPEVLLKLTDGAEFIIGVHEGAYFEACLINTLRKRQPIEAVFVSDNEHGDYYVEVRCATFPLFVLTGVHRETRQFPFTIKELEV